MNSMFSSHIDINPSLCVDNSHPTVLSHEMLDTSDLDRTPSTFLMSGFSFLFSSFMTCEGRIFFLISNLSHGVDSPPRICVTSQEIPSFSPSRYDRKTYLRKYKTVSNGHMIPFAYNFGFTNIEVMMYYT